MPFWKAISSRRPVAVRFTYEFAEVNEKVPMIAFLEGLSIK